ncbi:DMT family transporter [Wenzhouxiangella sp. XN201]|uniref:DMT family transporter n=1 Tax=Wenzhouxiangella sp. XN201 TaxID=2710755 RepID=UPI0013CB5A7E|nr:DMT family transporter [Wenzhouxiangella sp. XN201]NEZ04925.1 DMT family transporter [Wenzhouxiangella sp. XN201]
MQVNEPRPFTVLLLSVIALVAFAANSILTRAALTDTSIDPISFTTVRIASGAVMLWLIVRVRSSGAEGRGSWASALALFGYAIAFSLAYRSLTAATGALLLFGAVQVTMVSWGLFRGERLSAVQWLGVLLALAGLVWLLLPGLSAPPLLAAALMLAAGCAWGIYTLRAKGAGDPTRVTAANFARASLPAVGLGLIFAGDVSWDSQGLALAVASGALASGMGYAVWYTVLKHIGTHTAAVSQLTVPVITAIAGVLLLSEPLSWPTVVGGACILGGIALVTRPRRATNGV